MTRKEYQQGIDWINRRIPDTHEETLLKWSDIKVPHGIQFQKSINNDWKLVILSICIFLAVSFIFFWKENLTVVPAFILWAVRFMACVLGVFSLILVFIKKNYKKTLFYFYDEYKAEMNQLAKIFNVTEREFKKWLEEAIKREG